jgi:hypothetical protein
MTSKKTEVQDFVLKSMTTTLQQYLGMFTACWLTVNGFTVTSGDLDECANIPALVFLCIFITGTVETLIGKIQFNRMS